jgi:hypothetical protein
MMGVAISNPSRHVHEPSTLPILARVSYKGLASSVYFQWAD